MFRSAVDDEIKRLRAPCALPGGELPKDQDKDPSWRDGAVLAREELERLISDAPTPEDRAVLDALISFSGPAS